VDHSFTPLTRPVAASTLSTGSNRHLKEVLPRSQLFRSALSRLCILVLFSAANVLSTGAEAIDKVRFGTDWRAQAEHGGFYQAVANGIYESYGIEVTIRQGGPQINHSQLLAAGRLDFSMAPNSFIPLNFAHGGIPILSVAAIFQKDPAVLISHPNVGHERLEDLRGERIMISPDTRIGFWRFLKQQLHYTDDQIAPYTFNVAPFLSNPQSIQQGYLTSEPYLIMRTGIKPNVFLLADAGYASYAAIIQTSQTLVDENPLLVQRFVDASIKGWHGFLYGDPTPANDLIQRANPDMSDDLLAYGREMLLRHGIVDGGQANRDGIGAMTNNRWKTFFDVMVADELYPANMNFRKAYDLRFIGKRVEMTTIERGSD